MRITHTHTHTCTAWVQFCISFSLSIQGAKRPTYLELINVSLVYAGFHATGMLQGAE